MLSLYNAAKSLQVHALLDPLKNVVRRINAELAALQSTSRAAPVVRSGPSNASTTNIKPKVEQEPPPLPEEFICTVTTRTETTLEELTRNFNQPLHPLKSILDALQLHTEKKLSAIPRGYQRQFAPIKTLHDAIQVEAKLQDPDFWSAVVCVNLPI